MFPILNKAALRFNTPVIKEIAEIERSIKAGLARIHELRKNCAHVYQPADENARLDEWPCTHPICANCGDRRDEWWCPANSKGYCEYDYSEYCVHCEQPSERK